MDENQVLCENAKFGLQISVLTYVRRVDSSTLNFWTDSFQYKECLVSFSKVLPCFKAISVLNANSVDPDQTPRSAASDLGLHCLPMSIFWDAGHKRIKLKADLNLRNDCETGLRVHRNYP